MPRKAPAKISRRSFLATAAALAARPAAAATPQPASAAVDVIIVGAGSAGIAAARRIAAAGRRYVLRRGVRSYRRPLHHRHQDLRRAVRSRRPLDLRARPQSADQADAAPRHRGLSGAAEPENPHRPALCARRRAGGLPVRRGARHPRHQRRGAQGRRAVRAGDAERSRRLARDGRIHARPVRLRQGIGAVLGAGFFARRRAHHGNFLPPGISARCSRDLPKA